MCALMHNWDIITEGNPYYAMFSPFPHEGGHKLYCWQTFAGCRIDSLKWKRIKEVTEVLTILAYVFTD